MTIGRQTVRSLAMVSVAVLLGDCSTLAEARTIAVGPTHSMKMPSEAAAVVGSGDTVTIDPGTYFDCAVWRASNITVRGTGPGVILTDKTCAGKGIFVTDGNDITIENLTLTRARVPDANGAGIRAEGRNLTINNVRFINNENGILANGQPEGTIRITGSTFEQNGKCGESGGNCAHGIYINQLRLLRIENSRFFNQRVGHHIKSRATRTELINDTIEDGPEGTASYLVEIPNGGSLLIQGCTLQKGPRAENHSAAIVIGSEGVTQPTPELMIRDNTFRNDLPMQTAFVHNLTATSAQLINNRLSGQVMPIEGDGTVR
jgi:hypothetical protein